MCTKTRFQMRIKLKRCMDKVVFYVFISLEKGQICQWYMKRKIFLIP